MDYKTLLNNPAYPLPDYLYHSKIVASKKNYTIQKKINIENRLNKKEDILPRMPKRGLPAIEK